MPTYELKKHDNGTYYVHWTEGRRSKRVSTGAKEVDGPKGANAFLGQWLLMEQKMPLDGGASTLTMEELWAVYRQKHLKDVVSSYNSEKCWINLKEVFGALIATQVADAVEDYVEKREKGKIGGPAVSGTIRSELAHLRAMLNFVAAPEQKLLKPSEVPHFKLPAASEPRDRWLRTAELQKLIDAAAEIRRGDYLSRGEIFLWLALETAARKTAIVELSWDRVDFETKTIDYNVPGRKKTKKRRSTVPISKALLPILVRAFEERNTESDLVLGNKHDPWKSIRLIAKRAKVPGVSPHVLRHTAATHMARRGVPLWQIAGILANTVAMVEKVYAKHAPDGLVDAVNAISSGQLEAAE